MRKYGLSTARRMSAGRTPRIFANAEVEPLAQYGPGGYCPVRIGELFSRGRYKVAQKLGWGAYSTVWLAQDFDHQRLVALKILTADVGTEPREANVLRRLAAAAQGSLRGVSIVTLLDQFTCSGPNGEHAVLVFDVAGTSLQSQCARYSDYRLPARAAWTMSKQIAEALRHLHQRNICHGDLHSGNIMLSLSDQSLSDPALLDHLAAPYRADVQASPGYSLTASIPPYVVESVRLPSLPSDFSRWTAKLVDFGQSFSPGEPPIPVKCPLVFRAPETFLDVKWDQRMDVWSFACTLFELITGQTPFSGILATKESVMHEWMATFGDFPEEWRSQQPTSTPDGMDQSSLADWLHECYYDAEVEKKIEFAEEHIEWLSDLLTKMMRYRPEERLSMEQVLQHRWFAKDPFA